MEDTRKELERIQQGLLSEEEEQSLDDILQDEELNALLEEKTEPAFDDPEKIHDPQGPMAYHNFANNYGADQEEEPEETKDPRDEKIILGLMIAACVLCLGILGVLGYWLGALL